MSLTVESWIEALESGKYQQAEGKLKVKSGHCCLGVLCDISGAGRWDGSIFVTDRGECGEAVPPDAVYELIGLASDSGRFDYSDIPPSLQEEIATHYTGSGQPHGELTALNDNGVPFSLIAKVIRARPKGLFREDAA